jgi:hypothetical protein
MLVRFFRSHQPILLIIIPVIAAVLWLPAFLHPNGITIKHQMPLFELLVRPLSAYPRVAILTAYLVLLLQAFLFSFILDKYELIGKSSYLPALLYIVFCSFSPGLLQLHPSLIANTFVLLALHSVLGTYRKSNALAACFEAGLFMALASLFYFPVVLGIIFIFIAVMVLRPFSGRELSIILLGFLLPYIYTFTFYFTFDNLRYLWIDCMLFPFMNKDLKFDAEIVQPYFELILFSVIAALLSAFRGSDSNSHSVQHRSNITVIRWLFVTGLLTLLITPGFSYIYFFMALTPLLVLISGYFLWARVVWLAEIVMWMIVLAVVYNQY